MAFSMFRSRSARTTDDIREKGIKDVCVHAGPLNKKERCDQCDGPPESKAKAIEQADGSFHVLSETQWNFIEGATKLPTLEILDVQPLDTLPLEFTTASYFIRPDKKSAGAVQPFRTLYEALERQGYGLVTKYANSAKQKLAVIRVSERKNVLLLQVIPHAAELRTPGAQELEHALQTPTPPWSIWRSSFSTPIATRRASSTTTTDSPTRASSSGRRRSIRCSLTMRASPRTHPSPRSSPHTA